MAVVIGMRQLETQVTRADVTPSTDADTTGIETRAGCAFPLALSFFFLLFFYICSYSLARAHWTTLLSDVHVCAFMVRLGLGRNSAR